MRMIVVRIGSNSGLGGRAEREDVAVSISYSILGHCSARYGLFNQIGSTSETSRTKVI